MGKIVPFEKFENDIRQIISETDTSSVLLRIRGGAVIRIHSLTKKGYERLKRDPKHDMDFVTYSKYHPSTGKQFTDLSYQHTFR